MALWDKTNPASNTPEPAVAAIPPSAPRPVAPPSGTPPVSFESSKLPKERVDMKESVIASGLTIEGKIVGSGHVRVAGKFKGDIHVEGNLHIDSGAKVEGQVKASEVIVTGDLQGNIESAKRVELQQGGVITGDVKAGSFTVAAGSKMRGNVDFGWDEGAKPAAILGDKGRSNVA
jgi:cytoskeletal protein CcmA (bactofilin family)